LQSEGSIVDAENIVDSGIALEEASGEAIKLGDMSSREATGESSVSRVTITHSLEILSIDIQYFIHRMLNNFICSGYFSQFVGPNQKLAHRLQSQHWLLVNHHYSLSFLCDFFFSVRLLSVLRGHSFFHPCHNGQ